METHTMDVRIEELPERRFAVRPHQGDLASVEETRRPLYQHLIMHELVGGPPVLRFREDGPPDRLIDVLVGATCGFEGDDMVSVEVVPAGWFAVMDFEGPPADLAAAHEALREWVRNSGHEAVGALLQVHLMDEIDGETEQQLQIPVK